MTICEIRKKIAEKTKIDPIVKSRIQPVPDIKTVFYNACKDFAEDYKSVSELAKHLNIHHTTVIHHLEKPILEIIKYNKKTLEAYCLFYGKTYKEELIRQVKVLRENIRSLEDL